MLLAVIGLALVRIADTYPVFTHTWDEPAHIAAGVELLDLGTYTLEQQHPPLARLAMGLGPYLDGHGSERPEVARHYNYDFWDRQLEMFDEGRRILYEGPYERVLTLARLGNLPFVVIVLLATFFWARSVMGPWPAVAAAALLATIPPFLGHAGLATLDVAVASLGMASLFVFCHWLDRPGRWRAVALGVVTGATIMTKFSAVPFLAVAFTAIAGWRLWLSYRHERRLTFLSSAHVRTALASVAMMVLVFWVSYGPATTSIADPANRPFQSVERVFGVDSGMTEFVSDALTLEVVPAFLPNIAKGIDEVLYHNRRGHLSYLLGEVREDGWWYYYLVVLSVKTPLPLLILGALGTGLMVTASYRSGSWRLAAPAVALVALLVFVSVYSRINLGVRHVLILYPLLSIAAAYALFRLATAQRQRTIGLALAGILAGWQLLASVRAHPDNMAYFNLLAGSHPERILIATDLDWGQDLKRLEQEVRRRNIDRIAISYYGSARPARHDFPGYVPLEADSPTTGWVAISAWKRFLTDDYDWLQAHEPVTRVGTSIDLYYVPQQVSEDVPGADSAEPADGPPAAGGSP